MPDTKSPCVVIGVLVRFQVSLHAREHSTHASRLRAQPQLGTGHWTQRSAQSAHAPHRSSRGQSTIAGVCAQQKSTPERRKRSLGVTLGLGLSLLFPSTTTSTAPLCSLGYSGSLSSGLSRACYRVSLSAVSISRPERRVTSHSVEARWQIMVMVSKVLETIWACAAVSPAAPSSELGCGIDQLGQQAIDAHLRVDRCTDALRRAHGCTGTRMRRVSHLYMS